MEYAKVRQAVESLYGGVCSVTFQEKVREPSGRTVFREKLAAENVPCKLSFKTMTVRTLTSSNQTDAAARVVQSVKLMVPPGTEIPPGSRITVTQNGTTEVYRNSGQPAVFPTHQEVMLELAREWA